MRERNMEEQKVIAKIIKVGHSRGIIIPATILEMLGWNARTRLKITLKGKTLVISEMRKKYA